MAYVVMTARPRVQRSPRAAAEHASAPKRMHRRARACMCVHASYVRGHATRACHSTIEHCSSARCDASNSRDFGLQGGQLGRRVVPRDSRQAQVDRRRPAGIGVRPTQVGRRERRRVRRRERRRERRRRARHGCRHQRRVRRRSERWRDRRPCGGRERRRRSPRSLARSPPPPPSGRASGRPSAAATSPRSEAPTAQQ